MSDENKTELDLDIEDLAPRAQDVDDATADDVTGGFFKKFKKHKKKGKGKSKKDPLSKIKKKLNKSKSKAKKKAKKGSKKIKGMKKAFG